MTNDLTQLDVFHGDLTANRAIVYARLARPADDSGLSLSGQVRGPRCLYAETLPATSPLIDLGRGPTLLAQAVVPEPCFWSPDLPAIYDVAVNLKRGDEIIATTRREIGLKSLGVRGRDFAVAGKRWVLRGVFEQSATAELPRGWHEAAAAYVTERPDNERLAEASQWGAPAVVHVEGDAGRLAGTLKQLAMHPAVALAVVHGDLPSDIKPASIAPNIMLAQPVPSSAGLPAEPWAQVLWAEVSDPKALAPLLAKSAAPIIVVRQLASRLPIEQARAACDQLQRDLAPVGQFAGYVV
jgi:hypothetical protein